MLADEAGRVEWVIGVDTHRDRHVVAVVDRLGRVVDEVVVDASRVGYGEALRFADRHAGGGRFWAVEGTGCYGAGLCRFLVDLGERVWEVERPQRRGRDGRMKTDWLDARRAAGHVLGGGGSTPRQGAQTDALRLLLRTREGAVSARTELFNYLCGKKVLDPDGRAQGCAGLRIRRGKAIAGWDDARARARTKVTVADLLRMLRFAGERIALRILLTPFFRHFYG